mmetsp:Transcript_11648/g.21007  ORF Transcript_11648/g.21007 Transcript_11648/m.21007 type:complete len:361 (-) Transcript_11648:651-1733(-)
MPLRTMMKQPLMRCSALISILGLCGFNASMASALSTTFLSAAQIMDRRSAIATAISPFLLVSEDSAPTSTSSSLDTLPSPPQAVSSLPPTPSGGIINPNPRGITTIRIDSPKQSAGLELYQTIIGTPSRNVLAVRSVSTDGQGARAGAQRGMILLDYANVKDVAKRIAAGKYPIELRLYNLAMGGDAIGDLGRSIVTPEDALNLAEKFSGGNNSNAAGDDATAAAPGASEGLAINTIRKAEGECAIRSRRGDTMQIKYEANIGDANGAVYDSSASRGTGQPYAYVLGNGDMLRGVDLGTYDMCPGEVRELSIPPELGYRGGSRLYKQIPPNSRLFWRVELVEVNFVKEGENDTPRDEDFY